MQVKQHDEITGKCFSLTFCQKPESLKIYELQICFGGGKLNLAAENRNESLKKSKLGSVVKTIF